jgi:hypothetical protein
MATQAEAILAAEKDISADSRAYALATLMAGRILAGDRGAAVQAFQANRASLRPAASWQPVFTFLSAHALGPMVPQASSKGDNH